MIAPSDNPLGVGDIVTRTGKDRYRVTALYDGCDEVVLEEIVAGIGSGESFDLCWFDCEIVESRPEPSYNG